MANITMRSTVAAVKEEVTEGTPVAPTAGTDFVELQDGFDMSPQYEQLDSSVIRASIGKSKSLTGSESPSFEMSHYLKGSGTQGTAPSWGLLAKALFGAQDTETVEYATTVGSTVSVLAITGALANLIRGQALLIKDPINGYRIRAIHSLTTNAATLGFQLPTGMAPATGVNLGKAVTYYPANSGHPSLTIWNYLGNGGATQMMSGGRVTEMSVTVEAGQLINADFSVEGLKYHFNPIEITSSTRYLDFTDDDGTWAAAVTTGYYKDPHQLADAIQTAMQAANAGETPTVTYNDSTGKFHIQTTGTLLTLKFATGANTANTIATKIGFAVADESGTAATTGYDSDTAQTYDPPFTPAYDATDPIIAKNQEVMIGDQDDYVCFDPSTCNITVTDTKADQMSICAESGKKGSVITEREVSVEVTALLQKYDADKMRRYRANSDTRFQLSFGEKSGGNWVAGKSGCLYLATATVAELDLEDLDGFVAMTFTLKGYIDASGNGECYLSMT
jgi:hypothetical protein